MAFVVVFVEVAELDAVPCRMGKALVAGNDADVVDGAPCVAEKNKVTGEQAVFRYNGSEFGKFTGGAWQNHTEVFSIKVEYQP